MSPRFRPAATLVLLVLVCLPPAVASGPESGAQGRAAPDLTVVDGSYAVSPDPPRLYETNALNVTVINQGDADAGQFSVAFYLNNTTKSIGTATVNSLPAKTTANVSVNWATASTETFEYFQGVNYKIVVRVDSTSRVTESDETNNQFEQNQALGPPKLPDLELLDFTLSPASPVKGDLVTINVSYTNKGEGVGKFFRVYIYVDDTQQIIHYVDVATVNVSEVRNVSLRWDTSAFSIGAHTLWVYVNPEFLFTSVDENDYTNNNGSRAVVVAAPDFKLELQSLELFPAELHLGDTLNVTWTIRNAGARPAENFTVRITLDGDEFFQGEKTSLESGANCSGGAENDTSLLSVGDYTLRFLAGNIDVERTVVLNPMRLADLLFRNVSWDPPSPRVDQSVLISLEVANSGGLASNECDLGLFVDYSLTPVLQRDVPALVPGAYTSVRFLWDTTGLAAGTHNLRLQADSGTVVAEINESNNNYRWEIVLVGELDLALENLTIQPRPARVGDGVLFTLRVQNIGSLPTPATNLTLRIDGLPVDSRAIGALDRGRSVEVTLTWATAGLSPGNHTYELALDPLAGDVDPENNLLSEMMVLLEPPPAPDLRVSRIDLEPPAPRVGDKLTLRILVENAGNLDCGPSSVMIYLDSGTALLKFTDSPVPVPTIPVGGSTRVNLSRELKSFKAATYILNCTIDYKNEIAELNETNNRFSMDLELAEEEVQPPVLSVGEATLEGELRQGATVTIKAVVSNMGEGDARYVTVSFIIDGAVAGTVQLDLVAAGANQTASFAWTPSAGKHAVSVKAETTGATMAASPLKQVSVAEKTAGPAGTDMTVPIIAAVVVVAAVCSGLGLFLMRRKKGPSRQ